MTRASALVPPCGRNRTLPRDIHRSDPERTTYLFGRSEADHM